MSFHIARKKVGVQAQTFIGFLTLVKDYDLRKIKVKTNLIKNVEKVLVVQSTISRIM